MCGLQECPRYALWLIIFHSSVELLETWAPHCHEYISGFVNRALKFSSNPFIILLGFLPRDFCSKLEIQPVSTEQSQVKQTLLENATFQVAIKNGKKKNYEKIKICLLH